MAMINIPTPDLSGAETVEKKIDSLLDSYIMLRKELQYGLQNLSAENFTSVFNKTLKGNMGETAQMKFDVEGLEIRFNNLEGDFSSFTQTIDGIESIVSKADGRISSLTQTVNGFDLRVQNAEGNISALSLTVNDFAVRIGNAEGDISTLEQTASTLSTRIGNAEGGLSTLTQTVNSFSTRIESTEMSIADVMQGLEAVEGSIITTFYLSYYPTGAKSGDLLYHTSNKKTYRYNGLAWNLLEDKGINDALSAAQTAQSTADGKIVTYYQSNKPSTSIAKLGDIWIDTDAKNKMYRFNGTSWVDIQDKNISELIQTSSSLTSRISNVEGDVSTIEQTVGGITLAVNNSKLVFNSTGLTIKNGGFQIMQGTETLLSSTGGNLKIKGHFTTGYVNVYNNGIWISPYSDFDISNPNEDRDSVHMYYVGDSSSDERKLVINCPTGGIKLVTNESAKFYYIQDLWGAYGTTKVHYFRGGAIYAEEGVYVKNSYNEWTKLTYS